MKRLFLSIAALAMSLSLGAQTVIPEWDLHFWGTIVNDEFDISNQELATSGTIAAVRLSPYVGIRIGGDHRIMGGFDIMKDFGTGSNKPVTELGVWYQYDNDKGFTVAAGIIPYSILKGSYSTLIYSEASSYYDAHLDGFYLGWQKERSKYEVGLDWNGKFAPDRREEFNVFSAGTGWITPWLALCWEGMFHHYASSGAVQGVVDDHILHPYVQLEFSSLLPLDRLEFSLGGIVGYQMDRRKDERKIPKGADLVIDVSKWGFGVRNQFYYGQSQAPFYHSTDASGAEYGSGLYMRSSYWQIRRDGQWGLYDRLEAYWSKSFLNDYISLGVHAVFHFDYLGILGFQQIVSAKVNLENKRFRRN
jgi:hypothetical protein